MVGNPYRIFEYSASNIRARLVKTESGSLQICRTRIEVLGDDYSKFPSLCGGVCMGTRECAWAAGWIFRWIYAGLPISADAEPLSARINSNF